MIEIDTKASLDDIQNPLGYYQEKTDQLLEFGVEKVIWIFTDTEKIMVANQNEDWQIFNWQKDLNIIGDIMINLHDVVKSA